MNEQILERAFAEVYIREFAEFDNAPEHRFTLKHRLKMRRIFSLFEKKYRAEHLPKFRFTRKTVLAVIAIILMAAITGCTAIIISHFLRTEYVDHTRLQAADSSVTKANIENVYYISSLPDRFKLIEEVTPEMTGGVLCCKMFETVNSEEYVYFYQTVKSKFNFTYNTEGYEFKDVFVNGRSGLYLDLSKLGSPECILVWDNGDYIFQMESNLSEREVVGLAESIKY